MASEQAREALDVIFNEYLRKYQVELLLDYSPRRVCNKARRIGVSHALSLDCVLTSSGLWEELGADVMTANYNVISKRDDDAQDFIGFCDEWVKILAEVPELAKWVALDRSNTTRLKFRHSGKRIKSDTQSPLAGRGPGGHVLKDEAAWYRHALDIVKGADKVPLSDPRLRLTEVSTPNGTSGMGEVFYRKWTDLQKYAPYSRHEVDIYRAIDDGFPITVQQARNECFSEEEFQQEFCCKFLGSADEYFDRSLLASAVSSPPSSPPSMTVVGIDVASVVDLTAVVVMKRYGAALWIEDVYLVRGVPYADGKGVLGQESIVAGLLWSIRPDMAIIDASADGAELYGRLVSKRVGKLAPHSFHSNGRQWKECWVPRVRAALEAGTLNIAEQRPQVFHPAGAPVVTQQNASLFVETSFHRHHFDTLQHDFMRIRRKLLNAGITFDSPRDENGHGDSFWATCMAFSVAADVEQQAEQGLAFRKVRDATMSGAGAPVIGSDYGEYF